MSGWLVITYIGMKVVGAILLVTIQLNMLTADCLVSRRRRLCVGRRERGMTT